MESEGSQFIIFLGCYADVSVFSREIFRTPADITVLKINKIGDRADSRVQFTLRLRVMAPVLAVNQVIR